MGVGSATSRGGRFGVVGASGLGQKRERSLVDGSSLTGSHREALDADTFIIYGKASVEQYDEDDPPQKLEMEAFEDQIAPFCESGIISRRHKDIPVGTPMASYTLEEPAEFEVGDETLSYGEGDTLETGIRDGELWIVADLRNDSELARDTRLGALTGDLTGFSVTVFVKEWEDTTKGQRVTDLDWHATTIGADEQIKNKDSRFGVAEFKAVFGRSPEDEAERAAVEILQELPNNMSTQNDEKGFWERVKAKAAQKADEADGSTEEKSEEESDEKMDGEGNHDGENADDPEDDDELPEEFGDKGDYEDDGEDSDVDAVMEKVRSELSEQDAEVLQQAMTPEDEDDEEDNPAEEGELKSEGVDADELAEKLSDRFVTNDSLEEKMAEMVGSEAFTEAVEAKLNERLPEGEVATKSELDDTVEATQEAIAEVVPKAARDAADGAAEKMATGGTPDPSGGSANDEEDYMGAIQERFGSAATGGK